MGDHIGLYYPHFAFPDDGWMKLAALYWDKLGRIIPPDYTPPDSDTVQRLQEALSFTKDFTPSWNDTLEVSEMFSKLLFFYGHDLFQVYGIHRPVPENRGDNLSYVYSDLKMSHQLVELLRRNGLAVDADAHRASEVFPHKLVGMHPKLASIYMEALAEQMATSRELHPVTNSVRDHIVVGGYTLGRLTRALLSDDFPQSRYLDRMIHNTPTMGEEIACQMATIALQSVLPKDIASVPVEKIIQVRQQHRAELTAFQEHIYELTTTLDGIQQIDDLKALQAHLETAYEREIKPQVDDLRKYMKSLAIDTVTGILNIKVALPPLLAGTGAALHLAPVPPEVAGTAAIACSVFPVLQKKRREVRATVHKSPVAYLLYTEEGLTPTGVVTKVKQTTRRLLFGV